MRNGNTTFVYSQRWNLKILTLKSFQEHCDKGNESKLTLCSLPSARHSSMYSNRTAHPELCNSQRGRVYKQYPQSFGHRSNLKLENHHLDFLMRSTQTRWSSSPQCRKF